MEWSLFSLTRGGVVCGDQDTVGDSDVTVLHAHPLIKGGKGGIEAWHYMELCDGIYKFMHMYTYTDMQDLGH